MGVPPCTDRNDSGVDHKYRAKVLVILAAGLVSFWAAVVFVAVKTLS